MPHEGTLRTELTHEPPRTISAALVRCIRPRAFKRRVMEKYDQANLPEERGPTIRRQRGFTRGPNAGTRPEIDSGQLLLPASPYSTATVIGLALLPRLVLRMIVRLASSNPLATDGRMDAAQLLQSLRTFQMRGARYGVKLHSGLCTPPALTRTATHQRPSGRRCPRRARRAAAPQSPGSVDAKLKERLAALVGRMRRRVDGFVWPCCPGLWTRTCTSIEVY